MLGVFEDGLRSRKWKEGVESYLFSLAQRDVSECPGLPAWLAVHPMCEGRSKAWARLDDRVLRGHIRWRMAS